MLKYEDLKHVLQGVGDENVERFRGKTVVLFGSSGFLGNWFCDLFAFFNERYLNDSCTWICIDRVRGEPRRGAVMSMTSVHRWMTFHSTKWISSSIAQGQ